MSDKPIKWVGTAKEDLSDNDKLRRKHKMTEHQIIQANDNIFADLGFSPEEAENLRIRADLMLTLRNLIEARNWSIEQAAQQFGTSKDRIEALTQGDINQFQFELLIAMLTNAGMKVHVKVLPSAA